MLDQFLEANTNPAETLLGVIIAGGGWKALKVYDLLAARRSNADRISRIAGSQATEIVEQLQIA